MRRSPEEVACVNLSLPSPQSSDDLAVRQGLLHGPCGPWVWQVRDLKGVGELTNQVGGNRDILPPEHRLEGFVLIIAHVRVELAN